MLSSIKFFVWIGLVNLTIVALIGVIMRYKIGFEFPFLSQKNLLHAHSHFAFAGWVSHILYTFMVDYLHKNQVRTQPFNAIILINLICAFGMLISFIYQGYGPISITFSTLSIFVSYYFSWKFYISLQSIHLDEPSKKWFKAALLFNVLSSAGTFYLAWMMATQQFNQTLYLGSVYYYLHFQYSGWFFFAIMGLCMYSFRNFTGFKDDTNLFRAFFYACFPAFLLSVLWIKMPWYIFILPVVAVILQIIGLFRFLRCIQKMISDIKKTWSTPVKLMFGLALLALIIKLLLQTGSVFPDISRLAYGFRSIVIAYLHLILLGVTTLYLLGYGYHNRFIKNSNHSVAALYTFSSGVFLNELVLLLQGSAGFRYIVIPYLNEALVMISIIMFLSLFWLVSDQKSLINKDI